MRLIRRVSRLTSKAVVTRDLSDIRLFASLVGFAGLVYTRFEGFLSSRHELVQIGVGRCKTAIRCGGVVTGTDSHSTRDVCTEYIEESHFQRRFSR